MREGWEEDGRVVLVRRQGKILTLLYRGNRLMRAGACNRESAVLDNIYVGKVKNVVKNIQAAFVEFAPGRLCFLPLRECGELTLLGRAWDGRLLAGDELAVQIRTESQKSKEAGATTNLSFTGRYAVLTLTKKGQICYSRRLLEQQRERLMHFARQSALLSSLKERYGILLRTNAGFLTEFAPLEEELARLSQEADTVQKIAGCRTCYSLLWKAPAAYLKNLRDLNGLDYSRIVTDDAEIFRETKAYLEHCQPDDVSKLHFYEDELLPLCKLYSVEARLSEALERKVWLKSGAYIVIDRTEALTCIDVNSGKYAGKKDREETYFQVNLEAAQEIGRQLLLRNISGIIVIDFINMEDTGKSRELLGQFRKIVAQDPVQTDVVDMTPLGLVEVTRKREKKPLWEQLQ